MKLMFGGGSMTLLHIFISFIMKTDIQLFSEAILDPSVVSNLIGLLNYTFAGYQSYEDLPQSIRSQWTKETWQKLFILSIDEMTPCNKLKYIMNKIGKSLTSMINEQGILLHWHGYRMEITRAEFWSSDGLEVHLYNDYGKDFQELFGESYGRKEISDLILGKEVKMGSQGSMYFCDGKGNHKPLDLKRYE